MEASTAAFRKGTSDFLGWWFGELSGLVPTPLRHALKRAERTIAVTIDEDRISLTKIENGDTEPLVQFGTKSVNFDTTRQELERLVAKYPAGRWRWGLYLENDVVLHDRLLLPIAAKENFYEAVEFQIERHTPFKRSEIYFDCCPIDASTTARTLCVDYVIAPLERVDAAIKQLSSIGLPVDCVTTVADLSGEAPKFNLISERNTPRRSGGARLNAGLTILAVLLGGAATWLSLDNDRRYAVALSAQVETLRNQARVASQLRNTVASEQRSVNFVLNLKRDHKAVIQILNDLTRLLPDDSWVSRFSYQEEQIQIVIHAPESTSIVRLVEGSDYFSNARMMTAVRKLKDENRERFTLGFATKLLGTP
jgi:general secretion pathway protein L